MVVEVQLLGAFSVRVAGEEIPADVWRRRHAALLVKLLAMAPARRLHREQVIDQLWPDLDVATAGPRLHKAAHFARAALGIDGSIEARGDTICLLPGVEVAVDVHAFRQTAIDALADGSAEAAGEALALHGGELLPDDRYEAWTEPTREAVAALHLDLLRQAERWEEVLAMDPADETAHLAVARAYRDRGERAAALRQLDRLGEALERELGVVPGTEAALLRAELESPATAPAPASARSARPPRSATPTPRTRYADSNGHAIAYQVIGDGPIDLVFVPGFVSNIEVQWEHPPMADFFTRLASFARVVVFDKRATGLSERLPLDQIPTLEDRMDDVRAVMDAVGVERANLFGVSEGGPMALLFAATHPDRVDRLALYGSFAAQPFGDRAAEMAGQIRAWWGSGTVVGYLAPSWARDHETRRFFARYERHSSTPAVASGIIGLAQAIDARPVLAGISVPTLVVHRTGDPVITVDRARELAAGIPGAELVELPGADHFPFVDSADVLDLVERFITGTVAGPASSRVLATILFADIVDSTGQVAALGDERWRQLLEFFLDGAREAIAQHGGRLRSVAGDGFMATFDGPARAVRCGAHLHRFAHRAGLHLRCGVHTTEVEELGDDIAGIGVHIAARVSDMAEPGATFVTRTVRDLVAGSGLDLEPCGPHVLKGVDEPWELHAVVDVG